MKLLELLDDHAEVQNVSADFEGTVAAIDKEVKTKTHGADIAKQLAELGVPKKYPKLCHEILQRAASSSRWLLVVFLENAGTDELRHSGPKRKVSHAIELNLHRTSFKSDVHRFGCFIWPTDQHLPRRPIHGGYAPPSFTQLRALRHLQCPIIMEGEIPTLQLGLTGN